MPCAIPPETIVLSFPHTVSVRDFLRDSSQRCRSKYFEWRLTPASVIRPVGARSAVCRSEIYFFPLRASPGDEDTWAQQPFFRGRTKPVDCFAWTHSCGNRISVPLRSSTGCGSLDRGALSNTHLSKFDGCRGRPTWTSVALDTDRRIDPGRTTRNNHHG